MAMIMSENSSIDTIQGYTAKMVDDPKNLSDLDNTYFSELGIVTPYSRGESLLTIAPDNSESIAQSSGMNHRIKVAPLYERLTPSLISHGLVKGTIPMSMRKKSDQLILDIVSKGPDGVNVERPGEG